MMPMPEELIALMAICAVVALWLAWVARAEWRPGGQLNLWLLVEGVVGLFLMVAMVVTALIQVVARYALSDTVTLPWTEEFSRLAMIWAAFWGAALVQRSDDHISMTVVHDLLPAGARRLLRLFGDLVTVAVLVPVAWLGWQTARALDIMFTISLGMPLSVFTYPVAIGGALVIIHTVVIAIRRLRGETIATAGAPEL